MTSFSAAASSAAPPLDVDDEQHHHLITFPAANPPPLPAMNPQTLRAMAAGMFEKRSMSFSGVGGRGMEEIINGIGVGVGDDELSDDCSLMAAGEKKRRLSSEQVRTLERSFEVGSKLEPERKAQLARSLGLQPRQIAIWFQNRRARWKTKTLERDFDTLRRQFEALRSENNALHARNKKLQAEVVALKQQGSEVDDGGGEIDLESPMPLPAPTHRRGAGGESRVFFGGGGVMRPTPEEENFCGGIEVEQPPFWACWTEQQRGFR